MSDRLILGVERINGKEVGVDRFYILAASFREHLIKDFKAFAIALKCIYLKCRS